MRDLNSGEVLAETLNAKLGLDLDACAALAQRVFAANLTGLPPLGFPEQHLQGEITIDRFRLRCLLRPRGPPRAGAGLPRDFRAPFRSLPGLRRLFLFLPDSFPADSDGASAVWRENFIRTYLEHDIPQLSSRVASASTARRSPAISTCLSISC